MVNARREKARLTLCPCKPETFWLFELRYWYHQTLKRVSCVPVTINRHPPICTLPIILTHPSPPYWTTLCSVETNFEIPTHTSSQTALFIIFFLTSSIKTIHDLAFTSRTYNNKNDSVNLRRCGLRVVPLSFSSSCVTRGKLAARNPGLVQPIFNSIFFFRFALEGLSDVRLLEYRNSSIAVPLPFLCV